jgi:hypothetical protein
MPKKPHLLSLVLIRASTTTFDVMPLICGSSVDPQRFFMVHKVATFLAMNVGCPYVERVNGPFSTKKMATTSSQTSPGTLFKPQFGHESREQHDNAHERCCIVVFRVFQLFILAAHHLRTAPT